MIHLSLRHFLTKNCFSSTIMLDNFNFRSTTNIVKAAQKVISNPSSDSPQDDIRQEMKPMRGKGPSPRVLACSDSKAEGEYMWNLLIKSLNRNILIYYLLL